MTDEELKSALEAPPLPKAFSERVHRIARAELPGPESAPGLPLRLALSGAVVPALLVSAVAVRAVETVEVAEKIYDNE